MIGFSSGYDAMMGCETLKAALDGRFLEKARADYAEARKDFDALSEGKPGKGPIETGVRGTDPGDVEAAVREVSVLDLARTNAGILRRFL